MSLETTKIIKLTGNSKINDVVVKTFDATIGTSDPDKLSLNNYVQNYTIYKDNRAEVASDQLEFENIVYSLQDELIQAV